MELVQRPQEEPMDLRTSPRWSRFYKGTNPLGCDDYASDHEHTMTSKLDGVSADVGLLREQFAQLQVEVKGLREEVSALRLEGDELKQSNYDTRTRLDEFERKTDDLGGRSKRNNLICYELQRQEKETGADCEDMLRDFITDKLELADEIVFDRVHRLSSKPNSPVTVRCAFFRDKVKILKAKRKLY